MMRYSESDIFKRSFHLWNLSFKAINEDKEMLAFAALSLLCSLAFVLAMTNTIIPRQDLMGEPTRELLKANFGIIFLVYLGAAFIATFFNTCLVYTAKTRFVGEDATFVKSLMFAVSKTHVIFAWSLISATVGTLIRFIEGLAVRLGPPGYFIAGLTGRVLGAIWSVIAIFVVPAMVYDEIGPFKAIKRSAMTVRKTWGVNIIRYLSAEMVVLFLFVIGLVLFTVLNFCMYIGIGSMANPIMTNLAAAYVNIIFILYLAVDQVFTTALYQYTIKGKGVRPFTTWEMRNAFAHKEGLIKEPVHLK